MNKPFKNCDRLFSVVLATILFISVSSTKANADCGKVSITEMNWASASVITNVAKFLMEQGYGCQVTAVPSDTVPAATSLAENGEPDIVTEMWINSAPVYQQLEAEGKVKTVGNVLSDGGAEHWLIPKYLAEKHPELITIDGVLKNPQLVGGRFHNCPEGWGCRIINDSLKQAFNFKAKGMQVFNHGSGDTLAASLASAYEKKEPWFGYYWAPTALLGKYDMVPVELGPFKSEVHMCNRKPDCSPKGISSFPAARVVTGVTSKLASREPEIVEMLSKLSFTNQQMGTLLAWKKENNASSQETTAYFLKNYKKVWAGWLNDEARGKLAGILK